MADIRFVDADARIGQALAEDLRHRAAGPGQDGRHQLGDDDAGVGSERRQRGAQREAHAQSADQDPRPLAGSIRSHANVASAASDPLRRLFISSF